MKKLSKKWIIIPSILLVIIGITLSLILFVFNCNDEHTYIGNNEHTYIAYVDINPLIKLNFKVSCDKDNNCSNPIVSDYELINEDAKTIYKDLVIKDKPLKETIELLANTVKDKDIVFKEIHIYSNYDKEEDFKVESTDYNITFDAKTDEDLEQFIDELVVKKENTITKEIIVPVEYPIATHNKGLAALEMKPLEHEELFTVSEVNDYTGVRKHCIKVTVSGHTDIIDTLSNDCSMPITPVPGNTTTEKGPSIYGLLDTSELGIGTHNTKLNFKSSINGLEVLTPPIECQVKIVTFEDWKEAQPVPGLYNKEE